MNSGNINKKKHYNDYISFNQLFNSINNYFFQTLSNDVFQKKITSQVYANKEAINDY